MSSLQRTARYLVSRLKHRRQIRCTTWDWTSRELMIQHYAWIGTREWDSRTPPRHYNLHVQPLGGGPDYHNYHIRYLDDRYAQHTWSIVDAPYGIELSAREYACSRFLDVGVAAEFACMLAVTDITNDVGDSTLWLWLYGCLSHVLMDLYNAVVTTLPPDRKKSTIGAVQGSKASM